MSNPKACANPDADRTLESIDTLLHEASALTPDKGPFLSPEAVTVLKELVNPLTASPPELSQAAEAALTLAGCCISLNRVLNIEDPAKGDLNERGRIYRDRTIGDKLCANLLEPRQIPCSKGPFQSSSYRAGYQSPQVRNSALGSYVVWQSADGRTLEEVRSFSLALARSFIDAASKLPKFPDLNASEFNFTTYRRIKEELLSKGSKGAFEQYLLASLLDLEMSSRNTGLRAITKSVKESDASNNTPGDIQIRDRTHVVEAIEVSGDSWQSKLPQLQAIAKKRMTRVVIAATGDPQKASSDELSKLLEPISARLGIDPAIVDIHSLMDITAAQLTPHDRAAAFKNVYFYLTKFHRGQPELAIRLVKALEPYSIDDPQAEPFVSTFVDSDSLKGRRIDSALENILREQNLDVDDLLLHLEGFIVRRQTKGKP